MVENGLIFRSYHQLPVVRLITGLATSLRSMLGMVKVGVI